MMKQSDQHVDSPELQVWMGKEDRLMLARVMVITPPQSTTKRNCRKDFFFQFALSHTESWICLAKV